jgi:hypothetical protein
MNNEFLHMQKLAGLITESEYQDTLNENIPFPSWYDSFIQLFSDRFGVEIEDLDFEMVDPHLMGINAFNFSQQGMDNFPKDAKFILKQPEFKDKAIMVWDNNNQIEQKLATKHPELEGFLGDDEMFWIYIK